jgi:hypothetical protein
MITITREELKKHHHKLIVYIQTIHVMGPEIEQELYIDNTPVVGLTYQRGYFLSFEGCYIQYVMDHVILNIDKRAIGRRIDHLIIYENYVEYETERFKAMNGVKPKDQTGIGFN